MVILSEDELCQHMLEYSENVTYNSSSKAALSQVSRDLACCNDYQDAMVCYALFLARYESPAMIIKLNSFEINL